MEHVGCRRLVTTDFRMVRKFALYFIMALFLTQPARSDGIKPHVSGGWPYDTIPHIVDGGTWKTTIILSTLDIGGQDFKLTFYGNDGKPKSFSFNGLPASNVITGRVPSAGSVTLETSGRGTETEQGWALLDVAKIGITTVFGTTGIPGRPDFEATVPGSSGLESEGSLPFDQTRGYATGVVILNPTDRTRFQNCWLRDESGQTLRSEIFRIEPRSKLVFSLSEWKEAVGKRGIMFFFNSSNDPLSVLGLRFHPSGAFTTMLILEP
jgi:hypothetical protein